MVCRVFLKIVTQTRHINKALSYYMRLTFMFRIIKQNTENVKKLWFYVFLKI